MHLHGLFFKATTRKKARRRKDRRLLFGGSVIPTKLIYLSFDCFMIRISFIDLLNV